MQYVVLPISCYAYPSTTLRNLSHVLNLPAPYTMSVQNNKSSVYEKGRWL